MLSRLVTTFVEIALWRKGPQDLPASRFLAMLALIAYVAAELVDVRLWNLNAREAIISTGVDVVMLAGWLWAVLAFFDRRQRFIQTLTATLGVGTLVLLLDIAVRFAQIGFGFGQGFTSEWVFARLMILALIMGRILMHALDRGLITGMALTVAIVYSTAAVAQLMLDGLAPGP
ncbi:MAG TPA: hypothetical protein VF161_01460 [Steroidobacteraceae bacterium]|jgi:hypothetical protein